jgi:hypothetical protein
MPTKDLRKKLNKHDPIRAVHLRDCKELSERFTDHEPKCDQIFLPSTAGNRCHCRYWKNEKALPKIAMES